MRRRRAPPHPPQISRPWPPQLVPHIATVTDPHKPIETTGEHPTEPRLLVPCCAPHHPPSSLTATALTGTLSLLHLLLCLLSPAQTPLQPLHPFPPLSTAPPPCTQMGISTQASAHSSHQPATSTRCSISTSHIWELTQAGMEGEVLLRSTDVLGWKRSTAGASPR